MPSRKLYPAETIHKIFEQNAVQFPENIALIYENHTLTYQQLNQKANQLARFLQQLNLSPESLIAVGLPPGIDLIIAILAILKTGCAYVPLDCQHPAARLNFVLQDCQAKVLLTRQDVGLKFDYTLPVIFLDADSAAIAAQPQANLGLDGANTNLAYICYTSGSTGQPKGVMIEHKGVVRLVKATNYIQITPTDRIAQVTHITFDVSVFEIWGALLNAAALVCLREAVLLNIKLFADFLKQNRITILWLTARLFDSIALIAPEIFADLIYLIVGGEVLNPYTISLVMQCPQGHPQYILNGYGPTENSVFTTAYLIPPDFDARSSIPIGKPIANTTVYVLDDQCRPVAPGEPGELCTGGDGVARGYLNRPELNQERFIRNPFSQNPNDYLYRTGDMVFWRSDGHLEYIGRRDSQVKIRGFRVELGAIEHVLLNYPSIGQAIVLALPISDYERYLCAFVVAREKNLPLDITLIKNFLLTVLPAHSVPEVFIKLEKMPLTVNGKADRQALVKLVPQRKLSTTHDALETDVEKKLLAIWSKLFPGQTIGLDDDFFALGGHSLLLLRLQNKIESVFQQELSFSQLLTATTIKKQAIYLQNKLPSSVNSCVEPLQMLGEQPPLFLLPPVSGECFCYLSLLPYLNKDQPVYALRDPSEQNGQLLFKTLAEMADFYVGIIKEIQPHGPYRIGGYSFGAHLAIAISTQLIAAGESVEFLALIDGWAKFPPQYCEEIPFRQRMQSLKKQANMNKIQIDLAWQRMQLISNLPMLLLPVKAILFKAINQDDFLAMPDDYNYWRPSATYGIDRYWVPGNHDTMLTEPNVRQLGTILQEKLIGLQSEVSMT